MVNSTTHTIIQNTQGNSFLRQYISCRMFASLINAIYQKGKYIIKTIRYRVSFLGSKRPKSINPNQIRPERTTNIHKTITKLSTNYKINQIKPIRESHLHHTAPQPAPSSFEHTRWPIPGEPPIQTPQCPIG